jgi:hypothetical protein
MKFYKYCSRPIKLGDKFHTNYVVCTLTDEFIADNPGKIDVTEVNYVRLINKGATSPWDKVFWSVDGEFTGEIFELATLNNLEKFQCAPKKQDFKDNLLKALEDDYFELATKLDFEFQELLREAKKRYPIGTKVDQKKAYNNFGGIYTVMDHNDERSGIHEGMINIALGGIGLYSSKYKIWAEILKPVCKDHTGLEIYPGESVYLVHNKTFTVEKLDNIHFRIDPKYTVFCNLRDAEEWVEKNRIKSLEEYCHEMFITDPVFYTQLKDKEPKLYWTKVLQRIADELNKGRDLTKANKWFLSFNNWGDVAIMKHEVVNYGLVYFASCVDAQRASEIMGKKLAFVTPKPQ